MINHILVPTDFSVNAREAFMYAIALAAKAETAITLYHGWSAPMLDPSLSFREQKLEMETDKMKKEKRLKQWCKKAGEQKVKSVSFIIRDENSVSGIAAQAESGLFDLVVMGTKGASGIRAMIMGSNTAGMIASSRIPVLAIPARVKYNGMKNILAAIDYREQDIKQLGYIARLPGTQRSSITAVHIAGPDFTGDFEQFMMKYFSKKMKKEFPGMKLSFKINRNNNIVEGLSDAVKELQPDVLVMITEKRSWLGKLFWGSLTEKMSFCSRVPLLALPSGS